MTGEIKNTPNKIYYEESDYKEININNIDNDLITTDSYREDKLMEKLKKMKKEDIIILMKIAIHFSVIGIGGKQKSIKEYGQLKHNNQIYNIIDLMNKYDVKYNLLKDTKLKEDDFTPRRLIRFFRYQIQQFITKFNRPSYLYNKYCDFKHDNSDFYKYCFPGAEHMINDNINAYKLLKVANKVGLVNGFSLVDKIKRVYYAKGLTNVINDYDKEFDKEYDKK
jgi:hypothetical protein